MKLGRKKPDQSAERARLRPGVSPERTRKVYSYYNTGINTEQPTERKPRRNVEVSRGLKLLPGIIAVIVIVGSILYSFTLSTRVAVTTLQQQPSLFRNVEEYASKADEILQESPRNRTKLSVQTLDVEQALLDTYPELQDVVLRLPVLGRVPTLVVSIRQPAMLLATSQKTYVLDSNGVAISEATQLSAENKEGLPLIQDQSGIAIELGKQVLTKETVQFIVDASFQLRAKDYKISGLTLPVSVNELDIRIEGLPYFIKTDAAGNAREQMGSFISVSEYLKEQGITPAEYVDVRVEEKVFYK